MRLKDKIAIVTGGASGIGKAISDLFAAEGAAVVLADKNGDAIPEAVELIRQAGGRASGSAVDVTQRDQLAEFMDKVVAEYGRIDILINNAGISRYRPFATTTSEDWDIVLDVDLKGCVLLHAGGCAAYGAPELRPGRQYQLCARHWSGPAQDRGISWWKRRLRVGESWCDHAHEDVGARARPERSDGQLCRAGQFPHPVFGVDPNTRRGPGTHVAPQENGRVGTSRERCRSSRHPSFSSLPTTPAMSPGTRCSSMAAVPTACDRGHGINADWAALSAQGEI